MKLRHRNRQRVLDAQFSKRSGVKNKHHLTNKCRGGTNDLWNILFMDTIRHKAFHLLFGNKNLDEIIELLTRVKNIKNSQRERSAA